MITLAQTLKVVAEELHRLAQHLEAGHPAGEIQPPITTYTIEAYGAVYDLLKADGEL